MTYDQDENSRPQDQPGEPAPTPQAEDNAVAPVSEGGTPSPTPPPGPARVDYPDAPSPTSPMGVAAFVVGLLGVVVTLITGCFCAPLAVIGGAMSIAAWIFGHVERKRALSVGEPVSGLATAGWILGIIGTLLMIAWILLFVAMMVFGLSLEAMKPGGRGF